MATNITRWLGKSRPLGLGAPSCLNSNNCMSMSSTFMVLRKVGFQGDQKIMVTGDHGERKKPVTEVKASVAASESALLTSKTETSEVVDIAFLLANVTCLVFHGLKVVTRPRPWKLHVQMFIEKVIIDCRFFTMFAVAGTLLGSVLCFVEGCFMILESYLQYFHALSHGSASDHGHHVVHLLIEAMDMFLVGTAMLILGMGLHVMFVGTQLNMKGKGSSVIPASNFFGLFYLQKLPTWIGMQSITQAKSKMGHALMMILQVGVLDKFKSIPMTTGLDLACFAAALFISSASIFLLSRLSVGATKSD